MAFSSSSSPLACTPNITPLIDVLLVLLIIFMVIVPVTPRGLESLLPADPRKPEIDSSPSPLVLKVLFTGAPGNVLYQLDGRKMELPQLRVSLRSTWARRSDRPVLIGGDPRLDYQAVAMAIAETKAAGFQTLGILRRTER